MNFEGKVSAGSFHADSLYPVDEVPGPLALFWDQDAIKEKDRFDLVLAPCLLPYHALAGAYQMAIFRLL
jgi:hypothetical protein